MFKINVTPKFGDIDGLKHVTNTVVAGWFETGRNDIFRFFTPDLDLSYEKWKLIMARTDFNFISQMYYGFDVEIRTFIVKIGNSSFTVGHEAWQKGELKVTGEAVVVHYDFIDQKSKIIPEDIKAKLKEHMKSG
ncbi:acyl-CoA thioesterase [Methanobrevibacter filiformis]|uniref:Thioesterase superfamily protein n=1 Tax=Methanobrevibacter filiformis TaxID=55758 RepID=A0A166ES80_9EURY|nr:thioesterase family protein [Methanobrevibacter filiformis]KZX16952.1 thioesterase superfamily protein [Methanobrevibacter filiformis]